MSWSRAPRAPARGRRGGDVGRRVNPGAVTRGSCRRPDPGALTRPLRSRLRAARGRRPGMAPSETSEARSCDLQAPELRPEPTPPRVSSPAARASGAGNARRPRAPRDFPGAPCGGRWCQAGVRGPRECPGGLGVAGRPSPSPNPRSSGKERGRQTNRHVTY